jgi:hypothetical protein
MLVQANASSPASPSSPDLLSELLAALGPVTKAPKKSSRKPLVRSELPLPKAFSARKTGYVTWHATHRVLQVQEQICKCCGSSSEHIKAEFFALENGTAHATWLRPEGYGISAPDDLPNVFVDLEPAYITACPSCRSTPFDDLESLFHPRQLSLEL